MNFREIHGALVLRAAVEGAAEEWVRLPEDSTGKQYRARWWDDGTVHLQGMDGEEVGVYRVGVAVVRADRERPVKTVAWETVQSGDWVKGASGAFYEVDHILFVGRESVKPVIKTPTGDLKTMKPRSRWADATIRRGPVGEALENLLERFPDSEIVTQNEEDPPWAP